MMLGITLGDVLDKRAVIREEVGSNVNGFSMPNLAVFETILLGIQWRQESKLRANAEV